ncbi:hypothetical protein [Cytobacillus firmus]|uniref:hypothetical protein n=1 Tax=Cytobacillus firmus TaxID=1399 RepID=UPI003002EAF5
MYTTLDLTEHFNNIGVTTNENKQNGMLSLAGSSLPFEGPFKENEYYSNEIPFKLKKESEFDNISLQSQKIKINSKHLKAIHFVGNSESGSYFDRIFLISNGDVIYKGSISLTDFLSEGPSFNNLLVYRFHKVNNRPPHYNGSLWLHSIYLPNTMQVDTLEFEDNPFIHIFAITIEEVPNRAT